MSYRGYDETRPLVFYGRPVLCEGEAARLVVEIPERLRGAGLGLVLHAHEGGAARQYLGGQSPYFRDVGQPFDIMTPRVRLGARNHLKTGPLAPGEHRLRVYFVPHSVHRALSSAFIRAAFDEGRMDEALLRPLERLETYLVEERSVRVIPSAVYAAEARAMFGDEWDEPIYLDQLSVERFHELFDGWSLRRPEINWREWLMSERPTTQRIAGARFLRSLKGVVVAFMRQEVERLPFEVSREVTRLSSLPRVDLSKLMWVLSVLSSTWADLLLHNRRLKLSVSAGEGGLALALSAPGRGSRESEAAVTVKSRWDEPPLFRIVRESIAGSLGLNLSYDPANGVRLLVRPEDERNSAPFEYLGPSGSEPGQEFPPATL